MMLVIFIFLVSIIVLSINVRISIKSANDTIKAYIQIGKFYFNIPHRKIISKIFKPNQKILNKEAFNKNKSLIFNIISHSVLDRIYIAKYSKLYLSNNPIENGMYLIVTNQLRGLLHNSFKYIDNDNIMLEYDQYYENIDYYFEAHLSIISLIWASIKSIFKR